MKILYLCTAIVEVDNFLPMYELLKKKVNIYVVGDYLNLKRINLN